MMRRALREQLPVLSRVYGILPWHIDPDPPYLTAGEISEYVEQLAEWLGGDEG